MRVAVGGERGEVVVRVDGLTTGRPLPLVFAEAFTMAVEGLDAPRERLVAELRRRGFTVKQAGG